MVANIRASNARSQNHCPFVLVRHARNFHSRKKWRGGEEVVKELLLLTSPPRIDRRPKQPFSPVMKYFSSGL